MDDTLKINDSKQTRRDSSARDEGESNDSQKRSGISDRRRRKVRREWKGRGHGQSIASSVSRFGTRIAVLRNRQFGVDVSNSNFLK